MEHIKKTIENKISGILEPYSVSIHGKYPQYRAWAAMNRPMWLITCAGLPLYTKLNACHICNPKFLLQLNELSETDMQTKKWIKFFLKER